MTSRPALLSLGHQDTPAPASPGTGGGFSGKQGHFHMDLGSTRLREETLLPYESQLTGWERGHHLDGSRPQRVLSGLGYSQREPPPALSGWRSALHAMMSPHTFRSPMISGL